MKIPIKLLSIIALAAILIFTLTGCTETQYQPGQSTPSQPATTEKLQILNHSMSRTQGSAILYVKGTAKNISSSTLSYAEVRVKFYDAAGTLLDTSIDNINDLSAGETWSFEVMTVDEDQKVASYKIGVGTTF